MKEALKILGACIIVGVVIFGLHLAYDAHVKQQLVAAWLGGASSCQN